MPVLERLKFPLTIENLPSGLTAVATPQKITVKVGKKVKRDGMIVVPQIDQSQIDAKTTIDSVTVLMKKFRSQVIRIHYLRLIELLYFYQRVNGLQVTTVVRFLASCSIKMELSYQVVITRSTQQ